MIGWSLKNRTLLGSILVLAICGDIACLLGKPVCFDLRAYHYYNAYAFLHQRWGWDVFAADVNTFLNPLPELPYYLLISKVAPIWAAFWLGALHGLVYLLVYGIALEALHGWPHRMPLALAATAVAATGSMARLEFANLQGDNFWSLFILGAIYLMLRDRDRRHGLAAGLLLGLGSTAKLTLAYAAVGGAFAALVLGRRLRYLALFIAGEALGFFAMNGYWLFRQWKTFENPLFPFLNQYFHSPFYEPEGFHILNRLPIRSLRELVEATLGFLRYTTEHCDVFFRDARLPLLLALILLYLARRRANPRASWLAALYLASYLAWAPIFGVYRYLLPLELLAPLAILIFLDDLLPRRAALLAAGGVAIALALTTSVQSFPRLEWGKNYFGHVMPPLPHPERATVILTDTRPSAYLIPALPREAKYIRINSVYPSHLNKVAFVGHGHHNALQRQIDSELSRNDREFYSLWIGEYRPFIEDTLLAYGFRIKWPSCRFPYTFFDTAWLCPLYRDNLTGWRHDFVSR
jgi:hypothetical protein